MYYPDDFYNEPSEFDMQVEEFKESLAKAIRVSSWRRWSG